MRNNAKKWNIQFYLQYNIKKQTIRGVKNEESIKTDKEKFK